MISLQLRGRRQIAEPRKYCLVCVIVFSLACVFSIIFVSHGLGIRFNSLQLVSEPRVRFEGESGGTCCSLTVLGFVEPSFV